MLVSIKNEAAIVTDAPRGENLYEVKPFEFS